MGIARSTYYDAAPAPTDTAVVQAISAICDEFECYGWRRVRRAAASRHDRQSQEDQTPDARARSEAKMRRPYVGTTDSDHDQPIYPNALR